FVLNVRYDVCVFMTARMEMENGKWGQLGPFSIFHSPFSSMLGVRILRSVIEAYRVPRASVPDLAAVRVGAVDRADGRLGRELDGAATHQHGGGVGQRGGDGSARAAGRSRPQALARGLRRRRSARAGSEGESGSVEASWLRFSAGCG